MTSTSVTLSLGVSIVLYRTQVAEIESLLRSVLEQGAQKIYLVDNSPLDFDTLGDSTLPEQVTIIRSGRNVGYGAGHNVAIRDSVRRHRYHLVSNPDIHLAPGTLRTLYEVMESRPDVGLIMPEVVGLDGQRHYLCKRSPSPLDFLPVKGRLKRRAHFEMRDHSYDSEFEAECLSGCFMFFRSRVLHEIEGFDERFFMYLEDFDLSRRARRVSRNVYYPAATVVHEHRSGHRHSWRLRWAFAKSAMQYFSKWGWLESAKSREGGRPG